MTHIFIFYKAQIKHIFHCKKKKKPCSASTSFLIKCYWKIGWANRLMFYFLTATKGKCQFKTGQLVNQCGFVYVVQFSILDCFQLIKVGQPNLTWGSLHGAQQFQDRVDAKGCAGFLPFPFFLLLLSDILIVAPNYFDQKLMQKILKKLELQASKQNNSISELDILCQHEVTYDMVLYD